MAESIAPSAEVLGQGNDKLVGTWKLVSASSTTSAGDRTESPYGPSPVGFLTYTADGRVTALISYGGRKSLSCLWRTLHAQWRQGNPPH
jgi:hypothetical protein